MEMGLFIHVRQIPPYSPCPSQLPNYEQSSNRDDLSGATLAPVRQKSGELTVLVSRGRRLSFSSRWLEALASRFPSLTGSATGWLSPRILPQRGERGLKESVLSTTGLFVVFKHEGWHDMSRGADSLPKASQAARAAPADRPPMRFPAISRSDGNEPGATRPSGCDGRPEDQRLGPQAEATGG